MTSPHKNFPKDTEFSLLRTLGRFTGYFLLVLIMGTAISYCIIGNNFLIGSIICGVICYSAGALALVATWFVRRRYGIGLIDMLVAMIIRTGIPMVGALVIFALLDNNILNKAILSLAGYYLALFPFEVRSSMPRKKTRDSDQNKMVPHNKQDKQDNTLSHDTSVSQDETNL